MPNIVESFLINFIVVPENVQTGIVHMWREALPCRNKVFLNSTEIKVL